MRAAGRVHTLRVALARVGRGGVVGGCVRAAAAARRDCNVQLPAQRNAPASPAPQLLPIRGFYWPSIRFLCGTHLHTMGASVRRPPPKNPSRLDTTECLCPAKEAFLSASNCTVYIQYA